MEITVPLLFAINPLITREIHTRVLIGTHRNTGNKESSEGKLGKINILSFKHIYSVYDELS